MKEMLTIRTKDLQRLRTAVDPAHLGTPGRGVPLSVLQAISELVRCDEITFNEFDPVRKEFLVDYNLIGGDWVDPNPDPDFDAHCWELSLREICCSYPYLTGDRTTVRRATDFYASHQEFLDSETADFHKLFDSRYSTLIPLPPDGTVEYRLVLWRDAGADFSDRDQLLLNLLRPHLAELHVAFRNADKPNLLTVRQTELLSLVAEGLTNRQIAAKLQVSEGTVRTHMENIFERLGVNSRAAAVSHPARSLRPAPQLR